MLAPHEEARFRTARGERIERGLVRAFVEEFRQRLFLGPANVHGFATYDLRDVRRLIVHVADQDRLRRTDNDAGGLEPDVDAMSAEIAFLG